MACFDVLRRPAKTVCCLGCSFAQAVAAAQAGISVIQPNLGILGDWYKRHPGAIRDPAVRA